MLSYIGPGARSVRVRAVKIGERIKELRGSVRPRMSQAELARRAGVTPHAVYLWESGRRHPTPENLRAIAEALGVEVADLYASTPAQARPRKLPKGLQDMIDMGLADPPPTEEDIDELLEIPWRGEPDAVSYHYALQAIRRARARQERRRPR